MKVDIMIYFSDKWTSNADPARIPANFIKTITWKEESGNLKSISFDFPNKSSKGKSFWSFILKDGDFGE